MVSVFCEGDVGYTVAFYVSRGIFELQVGFGGVQVDNVGKYPVLIRGAV